MVVPYCKSSGLARKSRVEKLQFAVQTFYYNVGGIEKGELQ